ncbi:hypothetical protein Zm00014a_016716 [Zea mays]|uniref:Uncharacterized protein n=1 Tax=Zea mays TaxID=4577 RepID=A0A3L6DZA4_MAIZE|nr:hypothetical protein Zm00014a_016716 [Zea mays]
MAHGSASHLRHPPLRAAPAAIPALHLRASGISLAPALLSAVHALCACLPATREQSLRPRIPRPRAEPLLSMPSDPLLPRKENLQISPPSPPAICARWPSTGYARVTVVGSQVSPNSKRPRFERRPQQDVRICACPSSRGRRRWIQGHQRRPSPSSPNGRRGDVLLVHTKCVVHTNLLQVRRPHQAPHQRLSPLFHVRKLR